MDKIFTLNIDLSVGDLLFITFWVGALVGYGFKMLVDCKVNYE